MSILASPPHLEAVQLASSFDTLLRLSRSLAGAKQGGILADALDLLLTGAGCARGAAYAVVGDALTLVGERGLPPSLRAQLARLPLKGAPWFAAQRAAQTRKLVADRDLGAEGTLLDRAALATARWGQAVACPIAAGREVFGVLVFAWPAADEPAFSVLGVLEIACNMMALQMARGRDEQRRGDGRRADARAAWIATLGVLAGGFAEQLGAQLDEIGRRVDAQQRQLDPPRSRLGQGEAARQPARSADAADAVRSLRESTRRFLSATQPGAPESIELSDLAAEVLALLGPRLRRRRVEVELRSQGTHFVVGRRGELVQLFAHLLLHLTGVLDDDDELRSNRDALVPQVYALDVSRQDGHEVVSLSDAGDDGSGARASFFDASPQADYRFDFTVVREVVIAHEGHVEVASGPGGPRYRVVLPSARSHTERQASRAGLTAGASRPDFAKPRPVLLWIDEDELLLEIMVQSLHDFDVRVARSAAEALQILSFGADPSLICCSVHLPDRSGHELHAELARQSPLWAERLVFVTDGVLTPEMAGSIVASGRPALTRPINLDQVKALALRGHDGVAHVTAAAPTLADMRAVAPVPAGPRSASIPPAPSTATEPPPTLVNHGATPPRSPRIAAPPPAPPSRPLAPTKKLLAASQPTEGPRLADAPMRDNELKAIAAATADLIRRDGPTRSAAVISMLRDRGLSEVEALSVVTFALSMGILVRDPPPSTVLRVADGTSRGKVLVVDDDFDLRQTLREILTDEGFSVDTAANGREALDHLTKSNPPHVVVLDLMMPVMDGWQLFEQLKRDESLASVPVLVISASRIGLRSRHAHEILPKPLDYGKLIASVDRAIKSQARA